MLAGKCLPPVRCSLCSSIHIIAIAGDSSIRDVQYGWGNLLNHFRSACRLNKNNLQVYAQLMLPPRSKDISRGVST